MQKYKKLIKKNDAAANFSLFIFHFSLYFVPLAKLKTRTMELKNKKSAWAALATLGVTAVAAGATAVIKMREKRRKREEQKDTEQDSVLTAEQLMVYNEAVGTFLTLNKRIYELRRFRKELQPVVKWLACNGEKPLLDDAPEEVALLAKDIERFLTIQVPFINACLNTVNGLQYSDHVRGAVGGTFDATLDEEPTGAVIADGTAITYVLKLGYCFPGTHDASEPVKSIVVV